MSRFKILLSLVIALVAVQAGSAQQPQFRATSDTVPLFVTVTEKGGRLATNLTREDFEVRDNGKVQPLTLFDNTPQPIRLFVLIDISGSMGASIALMGQALSEVIRHLGPKDLMRVGLFGNEVLLSPEFTRDERAIAAWLPENVRAAGATPLWRTTDQAIGEFEKAPPGRRVILIFSDGRDSGAMSFKKFLTPIDIIDRAEREDVMIYGVGLRSSVAPSFGGGAQGMADSMAASMPDPSLGKVADDTGGGYFELRARDDIADTFARVIDEMHRQYLLGFSPTARDGKTHKIEVKVLKDGMKVRVRRAYLAPK